MFSRFTTTGMNRQYETDSVFGAIQEQSFFIWTLFYNKVVEIRGKMLYHK